MTQRSDSVGRRFSARGGEANAALAWPPPAHDSGPFHDAQPAAPRSLADTRGAVAATVQFKDEGQPAAGQSRRRGGRSAATTLLLLVATGEAVVIAWQLLAPGLRTAPEQPVAIAPPTTAVGITADVPPLPASPAAVWEIETPLVGDLSVSTNASGEAIVIVDGARRGTAPLTIRGLSSGQHDVVLVGGGQSIQQRVAINPGGTTSLVVPLAVAPAAAGWITVTMPFEVRVAAGGEFVGSSAQERLQFAPGTHELELSNEAIGYRAIETVTVRARQVTRVQPDVPTGTLSVNALPWADVWIDGRSLGSTPLGNVAVPVGWHDIRFRHPSHGEQQRRVLVTAAEPARVGVDLRQ